jgi:hypothetical protein
MMIEVLGPGCYRCVQTVKTLEQALIDLGKKPLDDYYLQKIEDPRLIAGRRVRPPAVIIDGRLVCQDRVPTIEEATEWVRGGTTRLRERRGLAGRHP